MAPNDASTIAETVPPTNSVLFGERSRVVLFFSLIVIWTSVQVVFIWCKTDHPAELIAPGAAQRVRDGVLKIRAWASGLVAMAVALLANDKRPSSRTYAVGCGVCILAPIVV